MKLKYNVTDAEVRGEFEAPKPGLYAVRVKQFTYEPSKAGKPMLTVQLEILAGEHKGAQLFDRILWKEESTAWKRRQLTDALQLPTDGELDIEHPEKLPTLQARVKNVTYEGERRAEVASLLPAAGDSQEKLAKGLENLQALADEEAAEQPQAPEAPAEEPDDYEEWELGDLKAELKERGLSDAGRKSTLINRLRENDAADPFKS